jgi:hypothetical protein
MAIRHRSRWAVAKRPGAQICLVPLARRISWGKFELGPQFQQAKAMRALASVCFAFLFGTSVRAATITAEPLAGTPETGLITITGTIIPGDSESFRQRIAAFPKGVVAFQSDGGNVAEAIEIGLSIRTKGYATLVASDATCASACAMAWLGGNPLVAGVGANIGFHAAYFLKDGQASEAAAPNAVVGAYYAKIGLSDRAIYYLTSAPPENMIWLDTDTASSLGIQISVVARPTAASPPITQAPTTPSGLQSPTSSSGVAPSQPTQFSDLDGMGARLADNFLKRYKKSGMVGLNGSITECYQQVYLKPQTANVRYCIALDLLASSVDSEAAKQLHGEQLDFDKLPAVYERASGILTFLNVSVTDGLSSAAAVERAAMAKLANPTAPQASNLARPVDDLAERQRRCSAEADSRSLHGQERMSFRQECIVGD